MIEAQAEGVDVEGAEGPPPESLAGLGGRFRLTPRWVQGLLAFCFYLLASLALWGFPILGRLSRTYTGVGKADAKLYIWVLSWWPYALTHGLNPFHSPLVWAPAGINVAWITGMPGPALLLWPITRSAGPIVSLNVLLLLAPPSAAWAGYLLCRRISGAFWAGVAGGYVFGFSSYEVAQMHGHANLALMFPVPLCAYLVVRRAEGSISALTFVALLAAALAGEFSISTEVFATMTLFGGMALLGAFVFGGRALRGRVFATTGLVAVAYLIAAVVVSPDLYYALRSIPPGPIRIGNTIAVDLESFVLPRFSTWIGGDRFRSATRHFKLTVVEDGGYLGALALVPLLFAITERRRRATWLLLAFLLLAAVASLGPVLHVGGVPGITLPWHLTAALPLLRDAVPARLSLFASLAVAAIVARWLAGDRRRWVFARYALVSLGAISILPVTSSPPYHPPVQVPPFFTEGLYRRYLTPNEIVLAIPDQPGAEMLWQVEANMGFRLARGYAGVPPNLITSGAPDLIPPTLPRSPIAFRVFVAGHDVGALLVAAPAVPLWTPTIAGLGLHPVEAGGIVLYRVPPGFTNLRIGAAGGLAWSRRPMRSSRSARSDPAGAAVGTPWRSRRFARGNAIRPAQ